jgi:hypothetical protein
MTASVATSQNWKENFKNRHLPGVEILHKIEASISTSRVPNEFAQTATSLKSRQPLIIASGAVHYPNYVPGGKPST